MACEHVFLVIFTTLLDVGMCESGNAFNTGKEGVTVKETGDLCANRNN